MDVLLRRSIKLTAILVSVAAAIFMAFHEWRFASGLLAGAAWSIINFSLLIKILEIAILRKARQRLSIILLIKFPILYLAGFLILASGFFSVSGLLAGLGSILLAFGVVRICPRLL